MMRKMMTGVTAHHHDQDQSFSHDQQALHTAHQEEPILLVLSLSLVMKQDLVMVAAHRVVRLGCRLTSRIQIHFLHLSDLYEDSFSTSCFSALSFSPHDHLPASAIPAPLEANNSHRCHHVFVSMTPE